MDRPGLTPSPVDGCESIVIIPAYNEGTTIGSVVKAARHYSAVLVIDDCSSDDTHEKAEEAGAIVVRNPRNMGYDATLNHGFEVALDRGFKYIVTMDADGEHDPHLLAAFLIQLVDRHVPVVLGVRPHKQRLSEVIMGWYVRARFGPHDILCGMKGYHARQVRENNGFDSSGSIGTELALKSIRRGNRFVEIAVDGVRRADLPRFGRCWQANMRIFKALMKLIAWDLTDHYR